MILVPVDHQSLNQTEIYPVKLLWYLSKVEGWNAEGFIKGPDGRFLPNTNVVEICNKSANLTSTVPNIKEVASLFSEAQVPKDLVINLKLAKLISLQKPKQQEERVVKPVSLRGKPYTRIRKSIYPIKWQVNSSDSEYDDAV